MHDRENPIHLAGSLGGYRGERAKDDGGTRWMSKALARAFASLSFSREGTVRARSRAAMPLSLIPRDETVPVEDGDPRARNHHRRRRTHRRQLGRRPRRRLSEFAICRVQDKYKRR